MIRKMLLAAVLVLAIVATLSGAEAGRRQSCFVYTVGVLKKSVTTPELCVPCVMGQPFCAAAPSENLR